jgi:hypothetical protein
VLEIAIFNADWCRLCCESLFASGRAFRASLRGAGRESYDAIYLVCSCGVLAFGHGDRPGQRVSGRDASCVQLQRRCSFQLSLRVVGQHGKSRRADQDPRGGHHRRTRWSRSPKLICVAGGGPSKVEPHPPSTAAALKLASVVPPKTGPIMAGRARCEGLYRKISAITSTTDNIPRPMTPTV